MSEDAPFLSRWSRRKLEAKQETAPPPAEEKPATVPAAKEEPPAPLPAVETLTPESDFKPFMGADVAPETRRAALKKLFADAHFNVPEQFEAYMGDYTKEDPIPLEMLKQLDHARHVLFDDKAKAPAPPEEPHANVTSAQPEPGNGTAKPDA